MPKYSQEELAEYRKTWKELELPYKDFPDWSGWDIRVEQNEAKWIGQNRKKALTKTAESYVKHTSMSKGYDNWDLGAMGELAFANLTGMEIREENTADNGLDFWLPNDELKLDVKVYTMPICLLVKEHKIRQGNSGDVFLLGKANWQTGWVNFLGFAYKEDIMECPKASEPFNTRDIINHYMHWSEMRSLMEFEQLLKANGIYKQH